MGHLSCLGNPLGMLGKDRAGPSLSRPCPLPPLALWCIWGGEVGAAGSQALGASGGGASWVVSHLMSLSERSCACSIWDRKLTASQLGHVHATLMQGNSFPPGASLPTMPPPTQPHWGLCSRPPTHLLPCPGMISTGQDSLRLRMGLQSPPHLLFLLNIPQS